MIISFLEQWCFYILYGTLRDVLVPKYSITMVFLGYGDDEMGFYTVYNEVFNTLTKEDMDHMDEQDSDFEAGLKIL